MDCIRKGACLCLLLIIPSIISEILAAPITFNTALPVGKREFIFREKLAFQQAKRDPILQNRSLKKTEALTVLGYGITEKLALFGGLPLRWNRLTAHTDTGRFGHSSQGIGDFTLLGRYTLAKVDWPTSTWRTAPFIGIEFPAGEKNDSDSSGRKPQKIQPGIGSWNPIAGVVMTFQTLDYQIDGQLLYKRHTNPQTLFRHGDVMRLDASLQYRLWPRLLGEGLPHFIYGVLETNIIHQKKNRIHETSNPDSGGTSVFLVPGLQYVTKRWIIEFGVQLPVMQNLNGNELKNDFIFHGGIRFNF